MNCIISNTSICGPRTKLGTNKNGWWKPKVNNNYGRLGFKFSSSHICSGCWFIRVYKKNLPTPKQQSPNVGDLGIGCPSPNMDWISWQTVEKRLEKAAHGGLKGCSHCAYLRKKIIAKMLDSPQPTFLMEWKWSCVAYSYIHTYIYIYIYIMCVYIGRQTYKHTIVYVHICIYAHITSHMIWFCLKMDWILRRPKKMRKHQVRWTLCDSMGFWSFRRPQMKWQHGFWSQHS